MVVDALSEAQQRVVRHDGGALTVVGGAGTGKTTALVRRYLRLAGHVGPDRVLVVARDRGAARRFRDAVLPHLRGAWDELPVTTAWGLAFDLLRRAYPGRRPPQLLRAAEQRALVRSMLRDEAGTTGLWPTLGELVGRRAFADEVASTLLDAQAALLDPDGLRAAAEPGGAGARWQELAGFYERYLAELDARGLVDGAGVLAQALHALADTGAAAAAAERHAWVLADDHEASTEPARRFLALLAAHGSAVTVAVNPQLAVHDPPWRRPPDWSTELGPSVEVRLDHAFRPAVAGSLVRCRHPAMEPEAVAGELRQARQRGVPWEAMVVLVRDPRRERAVARALSRHAIPVAHRPGQATEEPTVRGLLDLLRAANGDDAAFERLLTSPLADLDPADVRRIRRRAVAQGAPVAAQPEVAGLSALRDELADRAPVDDVATLAHRAFRSSLAHLVPQPGEARSPEEERALDALVAFLSGLTRYVEQHPGTGLAPYLALLEAEAGGDLDPWVPPPPGPGRVAITSINAAAGQEWDTVVLAGCVEGELPRLGGAVRFFDRAVLHGGPVPSVAERRQAALAHERRLFSLALTRATGTFVATAAPEPGVHVSRFVERWSPRPPRVALDAVSLSPPLDPTPGTVPMWPDRSLSLSATQLDTFEDCPLKHAYRYGLGIRSAGGVHAALGTLVHAVLARFLDPRRPGPRTRERLLGLAEELWSDDLAPYRPQLEEARRDLYDMLELWWEKEGSLGDAGPDVLATERAFAIPVGPHQVLGRIDRLDSDGQGGVRVVDYKTGKKRPREADVADDLQLATYRLAALRDPELAVWGPPTAVRILHLRSMDAFAQPAGREHPEATEARILSTAERILAEEREPAVDADCDHCELHRLCPLWPEGREVGQP